MSERAGRPRDVLALHYGIVLPEEDAGRLDEAVTRIAQKLPVLLLQSAPRQPGFDESHVRAPKNG
jgi:hypothetical protein